MSTYQIGDWVVCNVRGGQIVTGDFDPHAAKRDFLVIALQPAGGLNEVSYTGLLIDDPTMILTSEKARTGSAIDKDRIEQYNLDVKYLGMRLWFQESKWIGGHSRGRIRCRWCR